MSEVGGYSPEDASVFVPRPAIVETRAAQLAQANGMRSSSEQVCRDGELITAGHWSASTKDEWFRLLGLDAGEGFARSGSPRAVRREARGR